MKQNIILILLLALALPSFAQRRLHVQNVSSYDKLVNVSSAKHKVGSPDYAPLSCKGSPKIPVLLVQFSDLKFTSDTLVNKKIEHSDENVHQFYDRYCNEKGFKFSSSSYGSVLEYFEEQSLGQFTPEFKIIGPVTLDKSYKYYGEDTDDRKIDIHISDFYRHSLEKAMSLDVDWKEFDNNNNGHPDFVFFIYAGEGQNAYDVKSEDLEHSYLIWPKQSLTPLSVYTDKGNIYFNGFACTNEVFISRPDGIGTMIHEMSHGLGLPDLYDTNYNAFGMDYWDVMDSGDYCISALYPCGYSAYEKDFLGWLDIKELPLTEGLTINLEPISTGGCGYKLVNPANKNEYYILENRQSINSDLCIGWRYLSFRKEYGANHGLMVTHVDFNQSVWNSDNVNTDVNHQRFTILPADGDLFSSIELTEENKVKYCTSISGDLYPGSMNVTSIPASRFTLFTGGTLPTEITKITENEDLSITLEINGGDLTSIEDVIEDGNVNESNSTIYDMTGRSVDKPVKGLYIVNGKKVFVK